MDGDYILYFMASFLAQLSDSTLGMGFGTLSSSFLLSAGFPAHSLSATVHVAKIFSGSASAFSHWRLGNMDREVLKKLALPAALGALAGALLVLRVPSHGLKIALAAYFMVIGAVIVVKARWPDSIRAMSRLRTRVLGGLGGFLDAFCGAGWGEIVSSGLILKGRRVQSAVGSLNAAEILVTLTVTAVFVSGESVIDWGAAAALALGGMCAAPLGAWACKKVPARPLTFAVGLMVAAMGGVTLWRAF